MAFFVEDPRRKPDRWGPVSSGLVDLKWEWFWQRLRFAALFWEGGGSVFDQKNRLAGTLQGNASWSVGSRGRAVLLDGTDDWVEYADDDRLSFLNDIPFSICCGFKRNNAATSGLYGKYTDSDNLEYMHGWSGTGLYFILIDEATGGRMSRFAAAQELNDGKFHNSACTYDGSIKIYIDGARVDDTDFNAGTFNEMQNGTSVLRLGRAQVWSSIEFGGLIDYYYMLEGSLIEGQVRALNADPFGPFRMAVPAVWKAPAVAGVSQAFRYPYHKSLRTTLAG